MKIEVNLSGLTRVAWISIVEVPDHFTETQIQEVVDQMYDDIDGGEFEEDPHYWEKGECYANPVDEQDNSLASYKVDDDMRIEKLENGDQ